MKRLRVFQFCMLIFMLLLPVAVFPGVTRADPSRPDLERLKDETADTDLRLASLKAIRSRGNRAVAGELVMILERTSPDDTRLYRGLMTLLGEWRDPRVLPIAVHVLNSNPNQFLIDGAAYALGQLGDVRGVAPLLASIVAGYDRRLACRDALNHLGPAINEMLRSPDKATVADGLAASAYLRGRVGAPIAGRVPGVQIAPRQDDPEKSARPALEVGDVVYNDLAEILPNYDHAALYVGRVVDASGFTDAVIESRMYNGVEYGPYGAIWGEGYVGRYALPGLDFKARQEILATARDLVAAGVGYPNIFTLPALAYSLSTPANTRITIPHIDGLRCDGVVEYCYEFNGFDVWDKATRAGDHFDISYSTAWADEHNDSPAPPLECDREFAPIAQRGGCDDSHTRFQAATRAQPPQVALLQEPGDHRVTITAMDELSGIYSLEWAIGDGAWNLEPIQGSYPAANSQSAEIRLTESDWITVRATDNAGNVFTGQPYFVEIEASSRPKILFTGNRPNPFNSGTTLDVYLPADMALSLKVYDLSGRLVRTLLDVRSAPQGRNAVFWNGRDASDRAAPNGMYFCRLQTEGYDETIRMLLVK